MEIEPQGLFVPDAFHWLTPQGEVAALIRTLDWRATALGPAAAWPAELRSLLNFILASPLPMFVWWGPNQINFYNDAYIAIAGRGRHPHFLGQPACEMWPEVWPRMLWYWEQVRLTGATVRNDNLSFRLEREGKDVEAYFSFLAHPARDKYGQVAGVIGLVLETTVQLQAAVQARDEFLSIASHELKTPLTSLKLQLQMTQRRIKPELAQAPSPDQLARFVEMALRQTNRLTGLIEDLLDVARIQAGKLSFAFEEMDLSALVQEVIERFGEQLQQAGCDVSTNASSASLKGVWDRTRMEQVCVNLISNAIKYAPGRPLQISVESEAQAARLIVRDFGPGIAKDSQLKIFERFERANTGQTAGLGLGLYIVKKIVEGHGGTVSVESSEGLGSKFIVQLPLVPPHLDGGPG